MPVHKIVCDSEKVQIWSSVGKYVEVLYSALSGTRLEQAEQLVALLQDLLDYKQRITTLTHDDPDRSIDPARPELFWDGSFLVSRPVLVVAAPWSEERGRFDIQLAVTRTYQPGGGP